MTGNKDLTSLSFFNLSFVSPPNNYTNHSIWTGNFGNSFKKSSISNCCTNHLIVENLVSKVKLINNDTILFYYETPPYSSLSFFSNYDLGVGILTDTGKIFHSAITVSFNKPNYIPGFGQRNRYLEFIKSHYIFSSKMALVTVKSNPFYNSYLDRDTNNVIGLWRAGQPFQQSQIATKFAILALSFFNNDSIGFCAGYANYLGKSRDKGLTWQKLTSPPIRADWTDMFFIDSLHGWVYGRVLKDSSMNGFRSIPVAINTFDGGNTWFQIACDTNYTWKNKWFNRLGFGWAIRDSINNGPSQLVKTTDYGNSWYVQLSSLTERFEDMAFADTANGLIFSNFRNVSNNPPSKIYIKTSSTMGTFKKYL
ncbi:WD40/YVTN/BNR-like repeat-containing protein, partial [Umezakia ovalisporum]|uniref:WD40/YVTN/BNR-like repeat-containing protein n=1 Tax=Umezakia ovalisporum TaxID=75695 RepID=UPI0039C7391E